MGLQVADVPSDSCILGRTISTQWIGTDLNFSSMNAALIPVKIRWLPSRGINSARDGVDVTDRDWSRVDVWAKVWKVVIVSGRNMDVEDKKATVLRNWTAIASTHQYEHLGDLGLESEGPVISLLTLSSGLT